MATIVIYGASDDLVEIEGSARGCDEYNLDECVVELLPSSDRFRVKYGGRGDDAVWVVTHEHASGSLEVRIEKAPPGEDPDPYTDRAEVSGDIERVRVWETWPPTAEEIRDRVAKAFEDGVPRGLGPDVVRQVWEALGAP